MSLHFVVVGAMNVNSDILEKIVIKRVQSIVKEVATEIQDSVVNAKSVSMEPCARRHVRLIVITRYASRSTELAPIVTQDGMDRNVIVGGFVVKMSAAMTEFVVNVPLVTMATYV